MFSGGRAELSQYDFEAEAVGLTAEVAPSRDQPRSALRVATSLSARVVAAAPSPRVVIASAGPGWQ